jgi:hypothetical protein
MPTRIPGLAQLAAARGPGKLAHTEEERTMAKPLGPKTLLIREAIRANPDVKNKALAGLINASDARAQDKI